MNRATITMLLLCGWMIQIAHAQMPNNNGDLYGDTWLQGNYSQPYFKVNLSSDGIYRISYADIIAADNATTSSLPQVGEIQVYYRGQEIPIYVEGTGTFSSGEYIEFFGERNDGWMDKFLYVEEDMHANPAYSMFTNSSAYFVTWKAGDTGLRYTNYVGTNDVLTKEAYLWSTVEQVYAETYNRGETFTGSTGSASQRDGISPRYYTSEGYYKSDFSSTQSYTLNTPEAYSGMADATVTHNFHTELGSHVMNYTVGNGSYASSSFSGWQVRNESFNVASSNIGTTTTIDASNNNGFRSGSISIEYARNFNFGGANYFEFELNGSGAEQYVEINNFDIGTGTPILYNVTSNKRIVTTNNAGTLSAYLPFASGRQLYVLISSNGIKSASSIAKKEFTNYFANTALEFSYVILTSEKLLGDNGNGTDYVQQYADYRASLAGGNYNVQVVTVEQIYDQYGYGINRHEQGIKNFLKKAQAFWNPTHLFIIGKGWDKVRVRRGNYPTQFDVVPTFGYPHSDYGFVLDHNSTEPWMTVGRIGAFKMDQVRIYLNKVQTYETNLAATPNTLDDKSWAKKVLHFGGGDVLIQSTIQNTLNDLTDIIEPSTFGANVTNFFAGGADGSADPALALDYIRDGANMLTFFGHSAPNTIDFDIGSPEDYENLPNYPFFYAIGCNTNRIFDYSSTLSEEYVLIEDKGAIAWYGNTWVTSIGGLVPLANRFYENVGNDMYGSTFGEIFNEGLTDFGATVSQNSSNEMVVMSSMLHGDPALRLNPSDRPDYLVNKDETAVSPKLVSLQDNEFVVTVGLANLGKNVDTDVKVTIDHLDANGNIIGSYTSFEVAPAFKDTVEIRIPFAGDISLLGNNQIVIRLDADDIIDETSEVNNEYTLDFYVVESEIKPSYPTNYSIFPGGVLTLKASTFNSPAGLANYHFQIDSAATFDSPLLETTTINSVGGVIEWEPTVPLVTGRVYYWRVSAGNIMDESTSNWKQSSFTYLGAGAQEGWNQQHFYQFGENEFEDLSLNEDRAFEFSSTIKRWKMLNATGASGLLADEISLFEDGFRTGINNFPCGNGDYPDARLNMVVMNEQTLSRYTGLNPWVSCWGPGSWYMYDPNVQADRVKMINDIANVAAGDYILFYTTQMNSSKDYYAGQWAADSTLSGTNGKNIFSAFEARGDIQLIRDIVDEQNPYILIFQADRPDFLVAENLATSRSESIEVRATLIGTNATGSLISPLIGTASSWASVEWASSGSSPDDMASIDVIGIDANGQETILLSGQTSSPIDLSGVDAATYSQIKLQYNLEDEVNRTPTQLDYWRVYYTAVADLAVAPNISYSFNSSSLSLGDNLEVSVTVSNLSNTSLTSTIPVELLILDDQGSIVATQTTSLSPLGAQANTVLNLSYNTDTDLSLTEGNYQLVVNINPMQSISEICYMNNGLGPISFVIESCPTDRIVTTDYNSSDGLVSVGVSNIITASNEINSGAEVIYSAGTLITLEVGFHAKAGSDFHAFLGGCSLTPPARININGDEDENYDQLVVESRSSEKAEGNIISNQLQMKVMPNPVVNEARIEFYLPTYARVNLHVTDLNGKVVTQLDAMEVNAGWNVSQFYPGNLSAGIYLIILESEVGVQVKKFVVSK